MSSDATALNLDAELAEFLEELSGVQSELLEVLAAKRDCMASNNLHEITALHPRTEELCDRLKACHDRRADLLAKAELLGLPSGSLQQLATSLPEQASPARQQVKDAALRMRLLQHHSLTNWVLAQRTILHLSQLLEIVATGGQLQPTYSRDKPSVSSGALVDKEV